MRLAAVALAAVLTLTGCTAAQPEPVASVATPSSTTGFGGTWLQTPFPLPDATLTDTEGERFNLRTGSDKPVLVVFFGYTSCPDICIGTLTDIAAAMNRLEPGVRDQVQVILISVDPERDTPAVMKQYLARIDPSFVGLTGPLAMVSEIGGHVGVSIDGTEQVPGGYEVNHSTQVIGFDSERQGRLIWTQGTAVGTFRADLTTFVEKEASR